MSGDTPESARPAEDPTPADIAVGEPASLAEPAPLIEPTPAVEPTPVLEPVETPSAETSAAPPAVSTSPTTDNLNREVVYVAAPVPPRPRGNRGLGVVLAVLGSLLFAVLYAGIVYIGFQVTGPLTGTEGFADFIQNAAFWVPAGVFLVVFILITLLLNRAGWWAHILASLVVAVVVYFASIGLLLALSGVVGVASGIDRVSFADLARQPFLIIAAIVAREVSIWIGLATAARGRRVTARNLETRRQWELDQAEAKAEFERANAPA